MSDVGPGRARQGAIYRDGVLGRRAKVPASFPELERRARRAMSREAFAYVAGSAGDESTGRANRAAFDRWRIVPRVLRGQQTRDLRVELFGQRLPAPLLLAPVGVLEMAHPDADLAAARGAAVCGLPFVQSSQASRSMEQVAAVSGSAPRWFQLYASAVDELSDSFVARAEASGCQAVVLTVDTTVLGWRPRDLDLGYLPFARGKGIAQYVTDPVFQRLVDERLAGPTSPRPPVTAGAVRTLLELSRSYPGRTTTNLRAPRARAAVETFLDVFPRPHLSWADLERLRAKTPLPLLVKGLSHPDDARRAVECGADGVIVSNHGGRQVDGALASTDALPAVRAAVDVPVLVDSGVRTGADVVKALCLGADAVLVGRPYVYGLALDGAAGVTAVLQNLIAELDLTLALVGASAVADLSTDLLAASP
ncbi:MAG: lactate 2-monooxygenase [Actinomycetota bacterium]|nr:lactate 2-monooxygenase [Actinomycetota bacterium]